MTDNETKPMRDHDTGGLPSIAGNPSYVQLLERIADAMGSDGRDHHNEPTGLAHTVLDAIWPEIEKLENALRDMLALATDAIEITEQDWTRIWNAQAVLHD